MCKFKFDPDDTSFANHVNFMYEFNSPNWNDISDDDLQSYKIVPKPEEIPDEAIRVGTYAIRHKGYVQEYEYWNSLWIKKSEWNDYIVISQWELFPKLPHKEYVKMRSIPWKRLNKKWQGYVFGYFQWLDIHEMKRNMHLHSLKYDKEYDKKHTSEI